MRRIRDTAAYENLQGAVATALVETIRADLSEAGLTGGKLKAAVESIAFSVAAIYDGSAHVSIDDDHVVPVLGFAIGRMRDRLLLPDQGGSSVHEFVPSAIAAQFGQ
jgi:hypothetical protein